MTTLNNSFGRAEPPPFQIQRASGADGCGRQRGLRRRRRILGFFAVDLLAGLADVDPTLEKCSLFDADALGDDVSVERTFAADVEAVTGGHVAAHFTQDDDLARRDIRSEEHTSELQSLRHLV